MADRNLVLDLRRWATEEFSLPPESLPSESYFKTLCVGTGKSIWMYIIHHVFHQRNVKLMRGNLQWYKALQNKEEKKAEEQSEATKRRELQKKIEQLRAEISHLDSQICETEEQVATQEKSLSCTWSDVEDCQHRELLLQAFRQRCILGRSMLSDNTYKMSVHCQALDQMAKKAETDVLFDNEPSNNRDEIQINSKTVAEPQVLHEVRELCEDRVHFYQSLQENELKKHPSMANHMTHEQRSTMHQYWLSAVESVLNSFPPNHVLSALHYLASREQKELEEKTTSLDVTQNVTALQLRYESDHLLDISAEEDNELPPVQSLFKAAWEEVGQSLVELAQTRSRVQQLKQQLDGYKMEAFQEVSGFSDELHNDTLVLSAFNLELQYVMQVAARDHIRECCIQLDQLAHNRRESLRSLRSQWQRILDFRQRVVNRQEQIRGLIKGNSTTKMELVRLHKELRDFIQSQLVPQFDSVITAASHLRNSISKEAKQLGTVSLLSLDRRNIEGIQRIPVSWLSINRLHSPVFNNLCQSLLFPMFKAPEELCFLISFQQLELRFLCQLLQIHSATLEKIQKQTEQLHASDQKALLSRVTGIDQTLLKSLVPRVRSLTHRCSKGISYGVQVKAAISHWWDQPAQYVLPDAVKGGLTYQQWLQRWKLAAKPS